MKRSTDSRKNKGMIRRNPSRMVDICYIDEMMRESLIDGTVGVLSDYMDCPPYTFSSKDALYEILADKRLNSLEESTLVTHKDMFKDIH